MLQFPRLWGQRTPGKAAKCTKFGMKHSFVLFPLTEGSLNTQLNYGMCCGIVIGKLWAIGSECVNMISFMARTSRICTEKGTCTRNWTSLLQKSRSASS